MRSAEARCAFADDALRVELRLTAVDAFSCAKLVENIPLVFGAVKTRGARLAAPARGLAFRVTDRTGAGVEWRFEREQRFEAHTKGLRGQKWIPHVCGRAEVELPNRLKKGAVVCLRYECVPLAPGTRGE